MFWAPIPNNGATLEKDLIVLNLGYKSDKGWYDDFDCIFFYQIIPIPIDSDKLDNFLKLSCGWFNKILQFFCGATTCSKSNVCQTISR